MIKSARFGSAWKIGRQWIDYGGGFGEGKDGKQDREEVKNFFVDLVPFTPLRAVYIQIRKVV